jgi:CRISPR type III-A-associated RAMP protein Csm4
VVSYSDQAAQERWDSLLKTAIRLLADSGFGGERGRGWGRTASPSFANGELLSLILPDFNPSASPDSDLHWLLSLYSPAETDPVDWTRGNYATIERGGWVEGADAAKNRVRMIEEGSVLSASAAPAGRAPDVAPAGFAHPVFRAGFALSIPLPAGGSQ